MRIGWMTGAALAVVLSLAATGTRAAAEPAVTEVSISALQAEMAAGRTSAEALVRAYVARIRALDRGPAGLNSVIALDPHALEQARALDAERRAGHVRGPLHGIPVLVKDNIETADQPTTAGSLALIDNASGRDAPLVARLRAAGAVILGKTNLSEWANMRSSHSISGWSGVGGLVRNPYALDRSACGSSSGSGAAVAASFAAAAIGTETDGSVTCPSAMAGLVGLKPTVGLISRRFVVPISHSQDTPGPMARSVEDVALLLDALAGSDPGDPATAAADTRRADYVRALDPGALAGKRIGVMRWGRDDRDPRVEAVFDAALARMKAAGAEIVEVEPPAGGAEMGRGELTVLLAELKADLNAYLASTGPGVKTRTLADLIAFDLAHADRETPLFGQEWFDQAQATKGLDDPAYLEARKTALRLAGADGLDKLIAADRLDAIVSPTTSPAWRVDVVDGDHGGGGAITGYAAVAGYPHLTVPMGEVRGLPVGLSFVGPAWSEAKLLALGYAYEQHSHARAAPTYAPSVEGQTPGLEPSTPAG